MEGELYKELEKLGIAIKTNSSADVAIPLERQGAWPQWDYSYRMEHKSSGTVLAAGKVKAIDGGSASKKIAKEIIQRIASARGSGSKK